MNETVKALQTPDYQQGALPLLKRIAANLPGMIFQFLKQQDGTQFVIYASSGCRELFELEPEVLQANFQVLNELIHPQDIKAFEESIAISCATGEAWQWEGRIITASGKLKWIQGNSHSERQPSGDMIWDGLFIDITDRKLAEEKSRDSEARYKAILDAIPDLMFRISRDGKYLDFKGDGANVTIPGNEIVGKNLQDLLPPDVALKSQKAIANTLNSKTLQTCEYQLPTPLGNRDYEARLVVSGQDEVLAIVRDITERKQAEELLCLSSKRDRLLAQTLSRIRQSLNLDQILQTTVNEVRQFLEADRVFIALNDTHAQSRILAESVDPKYPSVLNWKNSDKTLLEELKTILSSHRVRIVEDTTQIAASPKLKALYKQFQIRANLAVPIMRGEELFGALIANQCSEVRYWTPMEIDLLQQMSEQVAIAIQQGQLYQQLEQLNMNLERQVEERTAQLQQKMLELQELNRVKDVVLHTVSHELRTSVLGNLMVLNNLHNLLNTGMGNGKDAHSDDVSVSTDTCTPLATSRERTVSSVGKPSSPCPRVNASFIPVSGSIIKRMIQGNDRQLEMIESLLELHTSEAQGIVLHKEVVSFGTLAMTIIRDLEPMLTQHQATVKNLVPDDLPLVIADPAQLQKVFVNLLTHSWQHNPPGIKFTLKATVETGRIRAYIQDDGVGMSKLECDRLFDLYVREPQARSSTRIGLKMYLCRQIIKAHGGEIGVSSNRKCGLTFNFTLPLATPS
ncbi:sensor histidine kinase [Mastigocladopsis repens]|uniref:sensor histidine kinase n=1 Tax=Mastigocladopsis repens TaxID=221287 RepID=UPI0002F54EAA|nr:GAF domain-containing protein [Mastigocladopsis repens]